ncbi:hypothetical protein J2X56_003024 [Herbaspirillum sp. 1173]|uniref:hypothetical protein n=1 Tax=Herbaspirillum sp. 1173 TaxID=2817734 RepID=UPI002863D7D2|nr:hypothetical protein [Herbaspirillum sp. 1173]MDR6741000.1 hypothetical protein [Herbaspirillum sp. 1173]
MTLNPSHVGWRHKYSAELAKIKNCPPRDLQTSITEAYRFAMADINHRNNVLPVAKIKPDRVLPNGGPIVECCVAFSLSMYVSLGDIRRKLEMAGDTAPLMMKRLGNHYVKVLLKDSDGQHTNPNRYGHFEFFERDQFNLLDSITEFQPI